LVWLVRWARTRTRRSVWTLLTYLCHKKNICMSTQKKTTHHTCQDQDQKREINCVYLHSFDLLSFPCKSNNAMELPRSGLAMRSGTGHDLAEDCGLPLKALFFAALEVLIQEINRVSEDFAQHNSIRRITSKPLIGIMRHVMTLPIVHLLASAVNISGNGTSTSTSTGADNDTGTGLDTQTVADNTTVNRNTNTGAERNANTTANNVSSSSYREKGTTRRACDNKTNRGSQSQPESCSSSSVSVTMTAAAAAELDDRLRPLVLKHLARLTVLDQQYHLNRATQHSSKSGRTETYATAVSKVATQAMFNEYFNLEDSETTALKTDHGTRDSDADDEHADADDDSQRESQRESQHAFCQTSNPTATATATAPATPTPSSTAIATAQSSHRNRHDNENPNPNDNENNTAGDGKW